MNEPYPIAIAISDLHLSLLQPACRADKNWMGVQAGYLQQVKEIARSLFPHVPKGFKDVPILCAGDIFDKWNAPPELINFALEHLPDDMICVPGQHDLPLHRTDLMHRSGYGVLKKVGKIKDLSESKVEKVHRALLIVHGFGWEEEIEPPEETGSAVIVALVHRYVWTVGYGYSGAPSEANLAKLVKPLRGYDVAVFGDNHQHFIGAAGQCSVLNCGTLIRRKSDEMDYAPCVGIIMSDGTCRRKRLDCSGDRFHEAGSARPELAFNMKEFIESLEGLGEHGLDFRTAVEKHLETEDLAPRVKEIILAALDNKP